MLKSIVKGLSLGLLVVVSSSVMAETQKKVKDPVSIELKAFKKEIDKKGKIQYSPANVTKPKDVIEYRATYTNNTAGTIKGLKATLPIPANTHYVGVSLPAGALASTDGINFAPMPLKKVVNGQTVNVPLNDYRALQWQISEVPAKKSVTVTAQAKVNSVTE